MAVIKKKLWPEFFHAVEAGKKKYELRLQDFDVLEGDTLILEEWDPKTKDYTGRSLERTVTYVGRFTIDDLEKYWSKDDVLKKGLQIISIE